MKLKLEKVKVGNLVELKYLEINRPNCLGIVTSVDYEKRCLKAIWSDDLKETEVYHMFDYQPIVNVWEVVDFTKEEK